jgi:hypothetical protein
MKIPPETSNLPTCNSRVIRAIASLFELERQRCEQRREAVASVIEGRLNRRQTLEGIKEALANPMWADRPVTTRRTSTGYMLLLDYT